MPSTKVLKQRIKSISNISQITKAMEMVSASKMKRAQSQALASRAYSRKLEETLSKVATRTDTSLHPLLSSQTESNKIGILILSTDKGLTGSLNTNLFRSVSDFQSKNKADIFTLGRIAKEFAIKSDFDLVADFGKVPDLITYEISIPIADLIINKFLEGSYSEVWLAYMDFVSTLSQTPRLIQLLPIQKQFVAKETITSTDQSAQYLFEPSPQEILEILLPYFVELSIYQSLLEARASEHSARMVAMKNASENASELVGGLSLKYNRSRQASITNELLDITTSSLTLA